VWDNYVAGTFRRRPEYFYTVSELPPVPSSKPGPKTMLPTPLPDTGWNPTSVRENWFCLEQIRLREASRLMIQTDTNSFGRQCLHLSPTIFVLDALHTTVVLFILIGDKHRVILDCIHYPVA